MKDTVREEEEVFSELEKLRKENARLKDTERAFKELEQIFHSSGAGIRIIDKDFNVIKMNRTLLQMTGVSEGEALKKKCFELCSSQLCHTQCCPLERILNGAESVEIETDKRRYDGVIFPCIINAKPYRNRTGALIGIIEEFKDITDRKIMEEAIEERQRYYEALLEALPLGLFEANGDFLVYANEEFSKLVGLPASLLLGLGWIETIHPDDRLAVISRWGDCKRTQSVFNMKFRLNRSDGCVVWVACKMVTYRGHLGENRYLGIFADITDNRENSLKLSESQVQLDLILDGISDAVILLKVEQGEIFRILNINNVCLKMIDLLKEDAIGKCVEEAFAPTIAKAINSMNKKAVKSGKPIVEEFMTNDGVLDTSLFPLFNSKGECTHLIVTARDVTEKKKLNEYILQGEKLESIGILAGGIAHDFNNILTAISGNVTLARLQTAAAVDKAKNDNIARLLEEAEKASLQARKLTQQLLTFARGGAPVTQTASIGEILVETATFALRGSNVQCRYLVPEDLWPVEIDIAQINQVIHNMVINADHAMPDGGEIVISAQNMVVTSGHYLPLEQGLYVKISVKDQGVGIPKNHINKIFDPYFTTKHKGSGLGLATSYSIIQKHKGSISVNSAPGKGTTFYIYLPASQHELVLRQHYPEKEIYGRGKVLIMDDEEMLRLVLTAMLNHLGYDILAAKDGAEALDLYMRAAKEGVPFDAVISDLTVPGGMGGAELIKKLVQFDPKVKAIVSSGYFNDPIMANYQEYGFKAVVSKPYSIEELGEVLSRVINNQEQQAFNSNSQIS